MTCGVNPCPAFPRASSCNFLGEGASFLEGREGEGETEEVEGRGNEGETVADFLDVDSAVPVGAYFLGLPLFLLRASGAEEGRGEKRRGGNSEE